MSRWFSLRPAAKSPRHSRGTWLFLCALCASMLLPVVVVLAGIGQADAAIWAHIYDTQLWRMLGNTIGLAVLTALWAWLLGTHLAWLVSMYEFRGRRVLEWLLMLPMAVPLYVMAFAQLGLLEYTGWLQTVLRGLLQRDVNAWFDTRSWVTASLILALALYPYVYLLCRHAFATQGARALEVGQSLGLNPRQAFWRIALPLSRPWWMSGVLLVQMECLADFGAVSILNIETLTTGVYKAWFALFSLNTAKQLASILILMVLAVVLVEQYWRGARRYEPVGRAPMLARRPLGQLRWAVLLAWGVVLAAFVAPMSQLCYWAWQTRSPHMWAEIAPYVRGSLVLGVFASVAVTGVAVALALAARRLNAGAQSNRWANGLVTLSTLGYAVPGTVLAVGIFSPVAWLDGWLSTLLTDGAWLAGGVSAMLWAYVVRFLAVGFGNTQAALARISDNHIRAAHSLGVAGWRLGWRVYWPLMRGGVLTALLMVWVDVMKEMPITLMMRPLGWDTLSVRIFGLTTEGMWQEAALPALCLVALSLIPVVLILKHERAA
ncbi:MAG: ABC transporter permease [Formosimonas sp.]